MVTTITPVVHGSRSAYRIALAFHALGAALAAGAFGAFLGATGAVLGAPWGKTGPALVVVIAVLYAARELVSLPIPLPHLRRQVPEWWRTFYGSGTTAFLYGAGLGVGWLTHMSYGTFAAVAAVALTTGDPVLSAFVCAPFGVARAAAVGLANWARANDDDLSSVARVEEFAASFLPKAANVVALACLVGVASFVLAR
jgi:hypothetical protein